MGDYISVRDTIKALYKAGVSYAEISKATGWKVERVRGLVRRAEYYVPKRRESNELNRINADGSQMSVRILALTVAQLNDHKALLEAHGFDPDKWQIVTATSNMWHQQDKKSVIPLYQSKITVKPISNGYDEFIQLIKKNTKPLEINPTYSGTNERYLIVAVNDTHFGSNTYDDYQPSQQQIINLLNNQYKETIIYLAGDLLDTDNLRGQTAHGTQVGVIDMPNAWADLSAYVEPLITSALKHSKHVRIIFTRGNHSESMEWAYIQYLSARYPQVDVDGSLDFAKAILLGKNFIGLSHGYKNHKNTAINFAKSHAMLWGQAEHHEIILGHQHRESTDLGAIIRVLPTRARANDWATENNFVVTHKAFQCFEYSATDISAVYYV